MDPISRGGLNYFFIDCIGQPIFEWRWAFRVVSGDKENDDKIILATDPDSVFTGEEWGVGIPYVSFSLT